MLIPTTTLGKLIAAVAVAMAAIAFLDVLKGNDL